MTFPRRGFLQLAAGTVALAAFAPIASAQTYPSRPITMVVPFPAAGPADVLARILAERMRETLGQPVVIENVTGAAGSIATGRWCARQRTATPSCSAISAPMSSTARSIRCNTTSPGTSSRSRCCRAIISC
jgi:tripartite-type tricarboxylate transporter receptor subunit TctC